MVKRVNFIEKGPFALTYRNMLILVGIAALVCLLVHGMFVVRYKLLKAKSSELKRQVAELTIQKEKTLAAMQIAQSQSSRAVAPLASIFVKMPVWSSSLGSMVSIMPKQLWLESVRSSNVGDISDKRKLEISGKSASHASIAMFVSRLEDLPEFQNSILVNSKKEGGSFTFVINTEVVFPEAEW
jgi:Tfp pilus assembly protein PilN